MTSETCSIKIDTFDLYLFSCGESATLLYTPAVIDLPLFEYEIDVNIAKQIARTLLTELTTDELTKLDTMNVSEIIQLLYDVDGYYFDSYALIPSTHRAVIERVGKSLEPMMVGDTGCYQACHSLAELICGLATTLYEEQFPMPELE